MESIIPVSDAARAPWICERQVFRPMQAIQVRRTSGRVSYWTDGAVVDVHDDKSYTVIGDGDSGHATGRGSL